MQFCAFCIKAIPSAGVAEALSLGLPFDELAILTEFQTVLETELNIKVTIMDAADESSPDPGSSNISNLQSRHRFCATSKLF